MKTMTQTNEGQATSPRRTSTRTTSLRTTPRNAEMAERAFVVLEESLRAATRQGFFGTVTLEVAVQDGTIQHLRKRVEELER